MHLLAFDLGGSGGKLIKGCFDGKKVTLKNIVSFENSSVPIGDGLYWEFIGIYRCLLNGLRKASADGPVFSLGIDSFSNDFGFIDKNGELLSPVRCYRDSRTARYSDYVYSRVSSRRLYELTGNQNARFNTLMQIGAIQAAGQEWILEHSHKMLFVPDLLVYLLTGQALAEYTISSVSQFFSFADQDFCDELLKIFNIRRDLFGPIVMPGTLAGNITDRLVREQEIRSFQVVSVCEHDTASAYLASPLNRKDAIIISSGTWALIGCEMEKPLVKEEGYHYNIANEGGYSGYHRFLKNVMGSWIIQEIRSDYRIKGVEYSYAELENAAENSKPFAFFIDVDDDLFFSPGNLSGKIREICRKRYGSVPEDIGSLIRCVYESLAMKYRRNLEILEEVTGQTFRIINIVGGGSKDTLMCRFVADACALPVVAGPQEATVLGNILVQFIAAGEIDSVEQGRSIIADSFPPIWYEPQNTAIWEDEYHRYSTLFPQ
jgi:sugar (pentulose or hexulose) kinase